MSSGSDSSKAQTFFQYGNDAAMKQNFDYAIQMYKEACKLDVENVLYRQALRGVVRKKFNNDPAKVGRLAGARNQPIRLRARSAKGKGNWKSVLEICEDAFVNNPWDTWAARDAAEAAENLNLNSLAQWLIESVQMQATDADFFRFAAHIHELNESWPKAIACWEKVKKLDPKDENVNRQINAISAQASIKRSGIGEAIEKRDETRAAQESAEIEEIKAEKLTPEERYLKEIKEDPTRVSPYLQLADIYKMRSQLEEAEKVLARGLVANKDDASLAFAHAEVQISRIQAKMEEFKKRIAEQPKEEKYKQALAKLTAMLSEYQIREYQRRLKLNPEEGKLHLEVGRLLAESGKHDEAIAAFQQARSSAEHKVEALHLTGLSFEAKGVLKLAERSYTDALKAADPSDQALLNALHYRLGRVAEAQGNKQIAEEHYNEVAANDYTYLDVAQRLQNLN